jgi:hypothetical protein
LKKLDSGYARLCKGLCEIVPQERREKKVFPLLEYAGINEDFDVWLGKRMVLAIIAFVIGFLLPLTVGKYFGLLEFLEMGFLLAVSIVLGLAFMVGTALLFYLHLYYVIEGRSSMVEAILPDFLMLVASNINAGMTPFSAFRSGARKEFGPLSEEIKIASAKSLGTRSFASALKKLGTRIKSRVLDETVSFFSQAMKGGGKLTRLLETSALDLRATQEMKKELKSSTRMYVLFVAFVIIIATPLLLAVSIQFLGMIASIQGESNVGLGGEVGAVAFLSAEMAITPDFMSNVSFLLLLGNALLAGLFVGIIGEGKAKMGLRYSPLIFVASVAVLFASNVVLGQFLGI